MKHLYNIFFIALAAITVHCSEDTLPVEIKGAISGTVVEEGSGNPLEGVKITTNPASTTVFTDENGAFIMTDVLIDDYSVQAELDAYVTAFESVTVTEDVTSNVAFELTVSTLSNTPPSKPDLIFPEDESENVPIEVTFLWSSMDPNSNDEVQYTLELRNSSTNDIELFEEITDTTFTISSLKLSTKYFWQVSADDAVNEPVTSNISEFTTFSIPDNPFLFVREVNGNNVIFSGSDDPADDPNNEEGPQDGSDFNVLQITDDAFNSFRPRKNNDVNKIAFLRTVGTDTHLFLMNLDGTQVTQLTSNIPVGGFRLDEIDFNWSADGSKIYYPNFNRIYEINLDGGGNNPIFTTTAGHFVSEISAPTFDNNLLLVKTNNPDGYGVRIFTIHIDTESEVTIVLEGQNGAAGSVDISANADRVLYTRDVTGAENPDYRIFESRMFLFDVATETTTQINTDTQTGLNELDAQFSPTEGFVVYTLLANNTSLNPSIFAFQLNENDQEDLLFTNSSMPDWQ